jgi:hypothetical protein
LPCPLVQEPDDEVGVVPVARAGEAVTLDVKEWRGGRLAASAGRADAIATPARINASRRRRDPYGSKPRKTARRTARQPESAVDDEAPLEEP